MNYEDRTATDVDVWGAQVHHYKDGKFGVSGTVKIVLSAMDGSANGPEVTFAFGYPIDKADPTVLEAEHALLTGATKILNRLAKEGVESLSDVFAGRREYDTQNPNPFSRKA